MCYCYWCNQASSWYHPYHFTYIFLFVSGTTCRLRTSWTATGSWWRRRRMRRRTGGSGLDRSYPGNLSMLYNFYKSQEPTTQNYVDLVWHVILLIPKKYSQLYQFYIQYNKWCLDYQHLSTGICPVWTWQTHYFVGKELCKVLKFWIEQSQNIYGEDHI